MPTFDLPLDELRAYAPELAEPADLDAFWADTLAEARAHDLDVRLEPVDTGLTALETWDVTYAGFGGHPVRGWLDLPATRNGPLPAVVQFQGYGGGRGLAHERSLWAAAGYAHFVMDTRGQGSGWSPGDTARSRGRALRRTLGFMTRGILDPRDYYYRRVFTDAVRAVEAVRAHPRSTRRRVAVEGASQGGGDQHSRSAALVPDVAARCAGRAVPVRLPARHRDHGERHPYREIAALPQGAPRTTSEQVLATLSYFDGAILARRATAPALFSVALDGRDLPAVDGVRGLQRATRRAEGDRGVPVQRPRGRRAVPRSGAAPVAARPPLELADLRAPVGDAAGAQLLAAREERVGQLAAEGVSGLAAARLVRSRPTPPTPA